MGIIDWVESSGLTPEEVFKEVTNYIIAVVENSIEEKDYSKKFFVYNMISTEHEWTITLSKKRLNEVSKKLN